MVKTNWQSWQRTTTLVFVTLGYISLITLGVDYGARNSWLFWAEHWTSDWRSTFLSDRPQGQHPKVAIVKVNEDTLQQYPYRTPIDRGLIARLVTVLDQAGAEVIAIDFLFLKETELFKDLALVEAIRSAKARIVVAVGDSRVDLTDAQRQYQKDFIERSGASPGFANFLTGSDRIVRFIAPSADETYPKSFAVAAAKPDARVTDGPRRIAWLLRPRDGNQRFLELPAHLLAAPAGQPAPPTATTLAALLHGRIVFIGAELAGVDRHLTPLASWQDDDEMAGVMLHAQVAAQLLDGRTVTRVTPGITRISYALLAAFGVWIGLRYGAGGYSLYFGTATLLIAGIDAVLFLLIDQFLPFGACLVAMFAGLLGGGVMRYLMAWLDGQRQAS